MITDMLIKLGFKMRKISTNEAWNEKFDKEYREQFVKELQKNCPSLSLDKCIDMANEFYAAMMKEVV